MHIYLKYHLFCTPLQLWLSIYYFAFIIEIVAWYYSNFFAGPTFCVGIVWLLIYAKRMRTYSYHKLIQFKFIYFYADALWRKWLHKYT